MLATILGGKEECPWGLHPPAAGFPEATSQAAQISVGGVLEFPPARMLVIINIHISLIFHKFSFSTHIIKMKLADRIKTIKSALIYQCN